jgi:hypothetical protein
MRRIVFLLGLVALSAAFASQAAAGTTTISVSMTFTESLIAGPVQGCTVHDGNCGSGEVIPLGHATETIAFFAGCGGACDFRTINLANGSIFMLETAGDFSCPGACTSQFPHGGAFSATLTDVIVGGTGIFSGATGALSGTVRSAAYEGQIKLAGTITLQT